MNEEDIAAILAGQTAAIAVICELLIKDKQLQRDDLCRGLYDLLERHRMANANVYSVGPIRHLLAILEANQHALKPAE
ncbi:hypothetical protein [Methylocystis parvus]|uniref:hypothetical protein n=1 Tax=Methylocystis parvus TaxID=134 RepID=UPI003C75ADEB